MISVVYFVIYPVIMAIFAKEYGVKRLKIRAYLLNYPYEMKVILAV